MEFSDAINIIKITLANIGSNINPNDYDGIIVKKIEASNSLDDNRTTNQTHIAITGSQMNIFPYVRSDGYFDNNESTLKKYFIPRIPINIDRVNFEYLCGSIKSDIDFQGDKKTVYTSIIRSKRQNQQDQIQVSLINYDDNDFISFRKQIHTGSYLVFLKHIEKFEYDAYAIKECDLSDEFKELNNKFYNLATNTTIDINANYDSIIPIENNKLVNHNVNNCLNIKRTPRNAAKFPLNLIIYGAPGTGKTHSTTEYALAIIENRDIDTQRKSDNDRKLLISKYKDCLSNGQIVFTTFHQNYGYEEFIQGLRPDIASDTMSFITADGVFKKIADRALNDPDNRYVIIIDEINRANISKVFGELITLIETDKRWGEINETCATLQSGDVFAVPNNLYIVGTMNSADKSISLIDTALRRRFEFFEQSPDASLIDDDSLKKVFLRLNEALSDSLESSDLLIGHSYFMGKKISDLASIFNHAIIPLLYEYFYDNRKKVLSILSEVLKDQNIEIIDNKLSRIHLNDKVTPNE